MRCHDCLSPIQPEEHCPCEDFNNESHFVSIRRGSNTDDFVASPNDSSSNRSVEDED